MRFRMKLASVTGAVVLAAASSGAMASPECGAIVGKAYAKLFKSLLTESAKACKAGSGETPAAVDAEKIGKATEKLLKSLQKGLDKAGDGQCPLTQADLDAVDPATVTASLVGQAGTFAASICNNDP